MDTPAKTTKRRKPLWLRILLWIVAIAGIVCVLLLGAVATAVWMLTPERLTPLVEKAAADAIPGGELTVGRIELTLWSTFPRVTVQADSVLLRSHALDGAEGIPAAADTLAAVERLRATLVLPPLATGTIMLEQVEIVRPAANVVIADGGRANYDIFKASAPDEQPKGDTSLPDIVLDDFAIVGDAPLRYISLPDSIDARATLHGVQLHDSPETGYHLTLDAATAARLPNLDIAALEIGANGAIRWNPRQPQDVALSAFTLRANDVSLQIDTDISLGDTLTVRSLSATLPATPLSSIKALVPATMLGEAADINPGTLAIALQARLDTPWQVGGTLPDATVSVEVPGGGMRYQGMRLERLSALLTATLKGSNLNASVVELKRLQARGPGIDVDLTGTLRSPLANPAVRGTFRGSVDFSRLPAKLLDAILAGGTVEGTLTADATFDGRLRWLNRDNLYRIKLGGEGRLRDFTLSMPEFPIDVYTRAATLRFGTDRSFVRGEHTVDSLLTLSLRVDTIAASLPGLTLRGAGMMAGIGTKFTSTTADTSQINPVSAAFALERARVLMTDSDTLRMLLRNVRGNASITRYRDRARAPLMHMRLNAGRAAYADGHTLISLNEADAALTLHPNLRERRDSTRRQRPRQTEVTTTNEIAVDRQTQSLLRRWRASGSVHAHTARLMTPYFPLRSRMTGLDLTFNNDSVTLRNTRLQAGRSDLTLNGSVTNLTRAVTSRRGTQTLRVNLRVSSDTIDVNQLAAAAFAGSAYAARAEEAADSYAAFLEGDNEDAAEAAVTQTADSVGPLLLPPNIEATVRLNARNILYANLLLHQLRGTAELYDGALNLRNLSARTDVGTVGLTALYSGLHPDSLSFAFGMQVRDFKVGRFLDLLPAIDSLMPLLSDLDGTVNAEVAATTSLSPQMDFVIPSLQASVNIDGDSLVLLDPDTYSSIGKWMMFKDRGHNVIDSMRVRLLVHDSQLDLFPFIFNIDRYRLGIFGQNDLNMNLRYHVAVLKSPIPFKFGINISGTPDNLKIRLGGAKLHDGMTMESMAIADTTRINLINQMESIFRRGARTAARHGERPLQLQRRRPEMPPLDDLPADTLGRADSLAILRQVQMP